ncbi:MAG: hypothetical protein HZA22_05695 [Nitrospirae bacterium]|nr:hypothetical protein [Nitrospirota bacterium]
MKKFVTAFLAAMVFAALVAVAYAAGPVYYVCGCGADCDCNSMSSEPGKCACNKDMVQMRLIAIDGKTAKFCPCGASCECGKNADPSKCGCGKDVKAVDITGKYACACGADCECGMISDKPGKCGCGKDMKLVE